MNPTPPPSPFSILTILLIPSNISPLLNPTLPLPPRAFQNIAHFVLTAFSVNGLPSIPFDSKCSKKLEFQPPPFFIADAKSVFPQETHIAPSFAIPSPLRVSKPPKSPSFLGIENPPFCPSSQNLSPMRPHALFPCPPVHNPPKSHPQTSPGFERRPRRAQPHGPKATPPLPSYRLLPGPGGRLTPRAPTDAASPHSTLILLRKGLFVQARGLLLCSGNCRHVLTGFRLCMPGQIEVPSVGRDSQFISNSRRALCRNPRESLVVNS
jgi:hypothetical protein